MPCKPLPKGVTGGLGYARCRRHGTSARGAGRRHDRQRQRQVADGRHLPRGLRVRLRADHDPARHGGAHWRLLNRPRVSWADPTQTAAPPRGAALTTCASAASHRAASMGTVRRRLWRLSGATRLPGAESRAGREWHRRSIACRTATDRSRQTAARGASGRVEVVADWPRNDAPAALDPRRRHGMVFADSLSTARSCRSLCALDVKR